MYIHHIFVTHSSDNYRFLAIVNSAAMTMVVHGYLFDKASSYLLGMYPVVGWLDSTVASFPGF